MKYAILIVGLFLLGTEVYFPKQEEKSVQLLVPEQTAALLNAKKVIVVEVTTEPGPAQQLGNILGTQGEPPVSAGNYFPQSLMISFADNQTVQATVYFSNSLPKGTMLTDLKPRGGFTAESSKEVLQLMAFDGEVQR
jgi:hypothetical protein